MSETESVDLGAEKLTEIIHAHRPFAMGCFCGWGLGRIFPVPKREHSAHVADAVAAHVACGVDPVTRERDEARQVAARIRERLTALDEAKDCCGTCMGGVLLDLRTLAAALRPGGSLEVVDTTLKPDDVDKSPSPHTSTQPPRVEAEDAVSAETRHGRDSARPAAVGGGSDE